MAKYITNIIIILTCFLIVISKAYSAGGEVKKIEYFIIKPDTCVVEKQSACEGDFEFLWSLNKEQYVCIYHQKFKAPLFCNNSKKEDKITLRVNVQSINEFTLVVGEQYSKATITLQKLGVDLRKTRRHLWSVF